MKHILLIVLLITLPGCVQYGTVGNGTIDPAEQEALEQIVDIVTDIIEENQKNDTPLIEPDDVIQPDIPAPDPDPVEPEKPVAKKETLSSIGRYNGDRPHWYGSMLFKKYPSPVYITVKGCAKNLRIDHDGVRRDGGYNGWLLKQSDVAGRGLGIVGPQSCGAEKGAVLVLEY